MIFRNGIKSNTRARGRTALFFCLIAALTFSLTLSLGVLSYSERTIEKCDETYRSIGLIEYTRGDYPDENAADSAARAAYDSVGELFAELPEGVEEWQPELNDIVFADGYTNRSSSSKYADYGVVVLSGIGDPVYRKVYDFLPIDEAVRTFFGYDGGFIVTDDYLNNNNGTGFSMGVYYILTDDGNFYSLAGYDVNFDAEGNVVGVTVPREDKDSVFYYSARISEVIYASDFKPNRLVNLIPSAIDFTLEKGKTYIAHGAFVNKNDPLGPLNGISNFEITSIKGYDGAPVELYDGTVPEVFAETAGLYEKINNCLILNSSADINDAYEFHQGFLYAEEGEIPSPDDAGACMITPDVAYILDVSVGDEINLTLLSSDPNLRYDLNVTQSRATLRVAGITNESSDYSGRIWTIGDGFGSALFGYRLGTLHFDNASAADAVERITPLLPEGVRLTLFDQGYGDAVKPLYSAINASVNTAIVSAFGAAAVMLIFAFLFVGRQSGNVKIMVSLGTPRAKIAAWLLSGAMMITISAAALGAVVGYILLPAVYSAVANRSVSAPLYSETALGVRKQIELSAGHSVIPAVVAWLGMTLLALLFCLIFMRRAIRAGTFERGSSRMRIPRGTTSTAGRGSVRFAALSIKRGGTRSLIVPAVAAVLTAAVIIMAGVFQGWQNELDGAYESMTISGNAVSTNGRYYSGLVIEPANIRSLLELDDIENVYVSKSYRYWLPDEMPAFGTSGFALENRDDWIATQPEITATNALAGAKEFYYAEPSVEWLDGWDESFLASDEYEPFLTYLFARNRVSFSETGEPVLPKDEKPVPAVIGDEFAEAHGLRLGDSFIAQFRESSITFNSEPYISINVVGIYKQTGGRAQIYVPLGWTVPPDAIFGEYNPEEHAPQVSFFMGYYFEGISNQLEYYFYSQITFSTCRFTFSSASSLDGVRETLRNAGFSRVGKLGPIRMTIVLNDASFIKLTETLGRYITTGKVMMAVIAALISACGFIISWLLINGRKQEFALMRGFGVPKGRIFASFFIEQALLCGAGTLVGCVSLFFFGAGGWLQPAAAAAFAVFYLAGCAVSVKLIGKSKLMELLSAKE